MSLVIASRAIYQTPSTKIMSSHKDVGQEPTTNEDEEQWAREQGVPAFEEPFIQKYLQGRDALVAQEKKQRSGSFAIRTTMVQRQPPI